MNKKVKITLAVVLSVLTISLGVVIAKNQLTPSAQNDDVSHETAVETTQQGTLSEETDVVPPEDTTETTEEETTDAASNGAYNGSNNHTPYTPSTTVVGVKKGEADVISTTIVCDGEKCTEVTKEATSYKEEEATVVTPPPTPTTRPETTSTSQKDASDDRGNLSAIVPVAEGNNNDDVIIVEGTTVDNERLSEDIENMF